MFENLFVGYSWEEKNCAEKIIEMQKEETQNENSPIAAEKQAYLSHPVGNLHIKVRITANIMKQKHSWKTMAKN